MRLPINDNSYFAKNTNSTFESVRSAYLETIKPHLMMKEVDVMLADGGIVKASTFEPAKVTSLFQRIIESMKDWTTIGISTSNTDDLHRIYCEFTQELDKYHLRGYFGIQFHALPYYRLDKRVIQIQRELAYIADKADETFKLISSRGNDIVQKELKTTGHGEMGFEELFTTLFEDENLLEYLETKALLVEDEFPELKRMHNRKIQLFAELDKLVIELYQISPVLMDYDKLMQGEEGLVMYFDIEAIKSKKNKERNSYLDTKRIDIESTRQIVRILRKIARTLYNLSNSNKDIVNC